MPLILKNTGATGMDQYSYWYFSDTDECISLFRELLFMKQNKSENSLQQKLKRFSTIEEVLVYFEIGFERNFIEQYRKELFKRFNGNLILSQADDWFSGRRALKNAYCKIQRGRLDKMTRSACRGCTSCERR